MNALRVAGWLLFGRGREVPEARGNSLEGYPGAGLVRQEADSPALLWLLVVGRRGVVQDPGPDLLVCDEAHSIKNSKAHVTQALMQVRTKRRIALTGSPLQNNLTEYYCVSAPPEKPCQVLLREWPPRTISPNAVA